MQVVMVIPYKSFKEKIKITKEYEKIAKMEIIEDKYIYIRLKEKVE